MSKIKTFKMIMNKSNSNKVLILTDTYQIIGNVHECEECNKEDIINLTNVRLCSINDVYDGICESDSTYEWLHVDLDNIVAFSFIWAK